MTASGTVRVQTPMAGLVELALRDPCLQDVISRAADRPAELTLIGPASARLFAASALAQAAPLLVVTATGREADDLTAELRGVFGDAARCSRPGRRCRTNGSRRAWTPSARG